MSWPTSWLRHEFTTRAVVTNSDAGCAVPVLLHARGFGVDAEAGELRPLAQAAVEFCESREARQTEHVVPKRSCLIGFRKAADHRTEECHTVRWVELQYRPANVLTGQRQGSIGFRAKRLVPCGGLEGLRELSGQARLGQDWLQKGPRTPVVPGRRFAVWRAVEHPPLHRQVQRPDRLTERLKVPTPLLVLAGGALAANALPLEAPSERMVERIITIALVLVLFDGSMHIGWSRFRSAAVPILSLGVLGTFLTTAGAAVLLHLAFGIDWYLAVLVATAVAPTNPAVAFSVLGRRQIAGRSGIILEGESGANDPVGIALMASLLTAGALSMHGFIDVGAAFLPQMAIGAVVGLIGGRALLVFVRHVPLPSEALYPLRTLEPAAYCV